MTNANQADRTSSHCARWMGAALAIGAMTHGSAFAEYVEIAASAEGCQLYIDGTELVALGCNVNIRDGSGSTQCAGGNCTGVGNLVVGYDEVAPDLGAPGMEDKSGSHNLVVGVGNAYTSWGGMVAGYANRAAGPYGSITGGVFGEVVGFAGTVSGGRSNRAAGPQSSVSGGFNNVAEGDSSHVSGGDGNVASGDSSVISAGRSGVASGSASVVSGGAGNVASGDVSSVSGGQANQSIGASSSVCGGNTNEASGEFSTVSGGELNWATAIYSSVSAGTRNRASGEYSSISGGNFGTASGNSASVSGGSGNYATGDLASVAGGSYNDADSNHSAICGGYNNLIDQGSYVTIAGGKNRTSSTDYSAPAWDVEIARVSMPRNSGSNTLVKARSKLGLYTINFRDRMPCTPLVTTQLYNSGGGQTVPFLLSINSIRPTGFDYFLVNPSNADQKAYTAAIQYHATCR